MMKDDAEGRPAEDRPDGPADAAGEDGFANAAPGPAVPEPAAPERAAGTNAVAGERPQNLARADTGEVVTALAAGVDAPDSLAERIGPAPAHEAEPELRISTILGPLPAGVSARKTRDLNDAVHQILVVGLAVSTVLLVTGLILELVRGQLLPNETTDFAQALARAVALRPSGFLSLGLLALMFTPIIRVVGSVIVFIWERDRLYTAITLFVLVVMTASVLIGHG